MDTCFHKSPMKGERCQSLFLGQYKRKGGTGNRQGTVGFCASCAGGSRAATAPRHWASPWGAGWGWDGTWSHGWAQVSVAMARHGIRHSGSCSTGRGQMAEVHLKSSSHGQGLALAVAPSPFPARACGCPVPELRAPTWTVNPCEGLRRKCQYC